MADDMAAEATTPETVNEVAGEAKAETETKDEKTPETPVTEPLTNGSSTPESPKVESPVAETPAAPVTDSPETKAVPEPEQLPVNGLSLEESKNEPAVVQSEEIKPEDSSAETTEPVPAPEIPVKKEDTLPVSDKIADLIPEVPAVPELITETLQETTSDVAVAN